MSRIQMTDDQIITDLKNTFGKEFTAADVRGYCASKNISYPTVTKRLEQFKIGRGKWNLEITQQKVQEIERSFNNVSVLPEIHQILFLTKMIPSSSLVTLTILKKLFNPVFFIRRSLRVCLVMVKRFLWSKRVLNLSVNSSV